MFKNLNATALGVSGRQSELIELAMTYNFRGLDIDIQDVVKRTENHTLDHANRFIASASIKVGGFRLPVRLHAEDQLFQDDLQRLARVAEVAEAVEATRCFATILPASDELPYHENFERHRKRLAEVADVLGKHQLQLGIGFLASPEHRQEHEFQFIHEAEPLLLLIKSVGAKNVGLLLDLWNWHLGGGSANQLRQLTRDKIIAVWMADIPEDADPAQITEEQRDMPRIDGRVDAVGALRLLSELEYEGPVTLAPYPRRFSGMTRDAIVQRASDVLDELWQEAGLGRTKIESPSAIAPSND